MQPAQKRAIMRQDRERRELREREEFIRLSKPRLVTGVDPYHKSRGITGVPANRMRNPKASENCWTHHIGRTSDGKTITKRIGYHTVGSDVKVITPNGTTMRSPDSFRKARASQKTATDKAMRNERILRRNEAYKQNW